MRNELVFYTYLQLFIDIFYFEDEEIEEIEMETEELENINKDNKEGIIFKINISEDLIEEEECFSLSDWVLSQVKVMCGPVKKIKVLNLMMMK